MEAADGYQCRFFYYHKTILAKPAKVNYIG
jgi:hypothetical protein